MSEMMSRRGWLRRITGGLLGLWAGPRAAAALPGLPAVPAALTHVPAVPLGDVTTYVYDCRGRLTRTGCKELFPPSPEPAGVRVFRFDTFGQRPG
jgi:hypothetical protein